MRINSGLTLQWNVCQCYVLLSKHRRRRSVCFEGNERRKRYSTVVFADDDVYGNYAYFHMEISYPFLLLTEINE